MVWGPKHKFLHFPGLVEGENHWKNKFIKKTEYYIIENKYMNVRIRLSTSDCQKEISLSFLIRVWHSVESGDINHPQVAVCPCISLNSCVGTQNPAIPPASSARVVYLLLLMLVLGRQIQVRSGQVRSEQVRNTNWWRNKSLNSAPAGSNSTHSWSSSSMSWPMSLFSLLWESRAFFLCLPFMSPREYPSM